MREGNSDEDDGVFLDNNSNGDIKYEYSGQSPVGGLYWGRRVGRWLWRRNQILGMKRIQDEGGSDGRVI